MKIAVPQEVRVYFEEPRLSMSGSGRFIVRAASFIGYAFTATFTALALLSDVHKLRFAGILVGFFLADKFLRWGKADATLIRMPERGHVNAAKYVRPASLRAMEEAHDRALFLGTPIYLELAKHLLAIPEIKEGIGRLDIPPEEVVQRIEDMLKNKDNAIRESKKTILEKMEILAVAAFEGALSMGHEYIEAVDIFCALSERSDPYVQKVMNLFSITPDSVRKAMTLSFLRHSSMSASLGGFRLPAHKISHQVMNRAWTSRPTPTLDAFSFDLTDMAREGMLGFMVGHEKEYRHLVDALSRPTNPNALLVGEVGIGKETLVSHLALQITIDKTPSALFDKRLVALEIGSLVAGVSGEELSARLTRIASEIVVAGNVILYIPDFHNLTKTGGAFLSAADALMPIVMNNSFPIIGATFPQEFQKLLETRSDITGVFEVIRMEEISADETEELLIYQGMMLESSLSLTVTFGAIKEAVRLSKRYLRAKPLPTSAIELLKETAARIHEQKGKIVSGADIVKQAETKVNVPIHRASEEEADALLHMEDIIHKRLIGQDEAVKAVATSIREYRSGLSRGKGPIASFLFVGPTGVGKTELAKNLARLEFGSEDAMLRFDMTEYQDKQSFFQLIGSPDQKVSGVLTEAVLHKPFSLVLLDELEKAYPDILNLFLQVLDDGRLTDTMGRTVDFSSTIIIATSNAHSDIINEALQKGETMDQIGEYVKKRLTDVFRPEFLNRFSKIVVFKNLSLQDVQKVAEINLADFSKVVANQGIAISFTPTAVRQIAHLGYDPAFGARPLRRAIDEHIKAALSEKILKKEIRSGMSVMVDADASGLVFKIDENEN